MQLRVARLCLDCEELHTDNACPRCASESYAFLSNWLHVEERRRWRRPTGASNGGTGIGSSIGRWIRGKKGDPEQTGPATRAADHVPRLDFEDDLKDQQKPAARTRLNADLSKTRAR
jgi:hypothetical protein